MIPQTHTGKTVPTPEGQPGAAARKLRRLGVIAGSVVLLDQVTKWVILERLALYQHLVVIPGFFNITHIQNPGGAFGFLAQQSPLLRSIVFLAMSFLAVCLVFWFYFKTPATHRLLAVGFALILGGAVGNLIDRVRFGRVVDFLDFYVGAWHWPAFNVADSAITTGIAIFLLHVVSGRLPD